MVSRPTADGEDYIPSARLGRVTVVPARPCHLDGMAACFAACFPGVFTMRMGYPFTRAFCCAYLEHSCGIAFVALEPEAGAVVGLVLGGDRHIRTQFLAAAPKRFWARLFIRALVDGVVRRSVLQEIRSRLWPTREPAPGPGGSNPFAQVAPVMLSLLQVIAVEDAWRGRGVAAGLMEAFRAASLDRGYVGMGLTVDRHNSRAVAFYRKMGWQVVAESGETLFMQRLFAGEPEGSCAAVRP